MRPAAGAHLPALTGLRFVLALYVVLHHLTGKGRMLDPWARTLPDWLYVVIHSGYLAVGTFFILSGFVLARSYASKPWDRLSLIHYGIGRWARVYPVYLLSLAVIAPIMFNDLLLPGRPDLNGSERAALLADYGFVLQGWRGNQLVNWNTPAWSLSCEFFFYLCFPLLAVLLRNTRVSRLLGAVGLALCVPSILERLGVPSAWKPLLHLADFLLGIATAGVYDVICRSRAWLAGRGYLLYVPAAAAGFVIIVLSPVLERTINMNSVLRPWNALLLLGLALGGGLPARSLSTGLAVFLGKASYSIYILHIPLLWWYRRSWIHLSGAVPQTVSAIVYLAFVLVVSAIVYRIVEEPANRAIRERTRSWLTPSPHLQPASG